MGREVDFWSTVVVVPRCVLYAAVSSDVRATDD